MWKSCVEVVSNDMNRYLKSKTYVVLTIISVLSLIIILLISLLLMISIKL